VFTPVLWPDFGAHQLAEAVSTFRGRERRFGRVAAVAAH
jgi:undecaprenyl diphosphate synthase